MTEDLPEFLRIPQERRDAAWRGRPLTRPLPDRPRGVKRPSLNLPQTMEPQAWALLKAVEKEKRERQDARLAALKERDK